MGADGMLNPYMIRELAESSKCIPRWSTATWLIGTRSTSGSTNLRAVFVQYAGVARRVALNGPGAEACGPTVDRAMRTLLSAGLGQDEVALVCRLLVCQAYLLISFQDDQRKASAVKARISDSLGAPPDPNVLAWRRCKRKYRPGARTQKNPVQLRRVLRPCCRRAARRREETARRGRGPRTNVAAANVAPEWIFSVPDCDLGAPTHVSLTNRCARGRPARPGAKREVAEPVVGQARRRLPHRLPLLQPHLGSLHPTRPHQPGTQPIRLRGGQSSSKRRPDRCELVDDGSVCFAAVSPRALSEARSRLLSLAELWDLVPQVEVSPES